MFYQLYYIRNDDDELKEAELTITYPLWFVTRQEILDLYLDAYNDLQKALRDDCIGLTREGRYKVSSDYDVLSDSREMPSTIDLHLKLYFPGSTSELNNMFKRMHEEFHTLITEVDDLIEGYKA